MHIVSKINRLVAFAVLHANVLLSWSGVCMHIAVSYTHLRAHETREDLVCRLLLEKKKERYAARSRQFSPSLPGDRNRKFGSKSGHRAQISRNFVRYDALLMKSFCLLIRLTFAKAFSKMKQLKMTAYKVDLHSA